MPKLVDLDGHIDAKGIEYIGKASLQANGLYKCMAVVEGCLCIVEVKLTPLPEESR